MSIHALNAVWGNAPFKGGTLLVLLALADYADDDGWSWPAVSTVAHKARLSERAVQYAMDEAEREGWLQVSKKTGPHGVNEYRVTGVQFLRGCKESAQIAPDPSDPDLTSDLDQDSGSLSGSDDWGANLAPSLRRSRHHGPFDRFIRRS